jgi:hypothetical protein
MFHSSPDFMVYMFPDAHTFRVLRGGMTLSHGKQRNRTDMLGE